MKRALIPLSLFLFAALVYAPATSYSFMYDDPLDLTRAEGRTLWSLLTSAQGYAYFRPLPFIIWQAMHEMLGRYDPFWYHLVPVLIHAVNSSLIYFLCKRLAGSRSAFCAAILFAVYPFSYQAVLGSSALFHPLVTLFILGAVLGYARARAGQRWPWLGLSLACAVLALLSHEEAVILGPLITLWEVQEWWRQRPERPGVRPALWPLAYWGLSLAYVVLWLAVPKKTVNALVGLDSIAQSALYFLQGFAYPLTGTLTWLGAATHTDQQTLLPFAVAAALFFLLAAYGRGRMLPTLMLASAWFAISGLPVWLALNFAYVVDGPRLLYLPSVGIAIAWGGLFSLRFQSAGFGRWWRSLCLLLALAITFSSLAFLSRRDQLYGQGSRIVRDFVATASAEGNTARLLAVNLPSWLALREAEYPMGHSGVTMIPSYVGLDQVVYVHTGIRPKIKALTYADILKPWQYYLGPYSESADLRAFDAALRQTDTAYITDILPDQLVIHRVGSLHSEGLPRGAGIATWDQAIILQNATARIESGVIVAELDWACQQANTDDRTVFLHLYDGAGKLVAQADGYPLGNLSALQFWQPGDIVHDVRRLDVSPDLPSGSYTLAVGLYDRKTGQRISVVDSNGTTYVDAAVRFAHITWR